MLWFLVAGFTAVFLAHTAPFPFLLERFAPSKSLWHVPRGTGPPTIYLIYDDRPNPNARHGDGPFTGRRQPEYSAIHTRAEAFVPVA